MPQVRDWTAMRDNAARLLKERTGHDLAHWLARARAEAPADKEGVKAWLTREGVTGYGRERSFIGWVPTVAGRLSFSHVGQSRFPSPCDTLNDDDAKGRVILCAQKRILTDALISAPYFKFLYGFDPTWLFFLWCILRAWAQTGLACSKAQS